MKRIIFDIFLCLSLFSLPWQITLFFLILGIFLFNNFYEFLIIMVVQYALFAIPGNVLYSSPLWFSICTSFVFIGVQILKQYMSIYKNEILH